MGEFLFEDRIYEEATRRGDAERLAAPIPASARYEVGSKRIVVEFKNGAAFMVPAHALQGLEHATDEQLSEVELLGETGLHWESLDVDFRISGLMAGLFGTARFMDASRRGGQSRSEAKAAAARINGAKGGRPRKVS